MSKAILVIDVPDKYKDKDLVIVGDYLRLGYLDEYCIKEIEELDTEVLHLKELPKENTDEDMWKDDDNEPYTHEDMLHAYIDGMKMGRNLLLDEILGEDK